MSQRDKLKVERIIAFIIPHDVMLSEKGRIMRHFDEVHAANMAMSLATNLQNAGKNVTVFLDTNGVNIGVQQPSFILNGTATMLKNLIANGGSVWVCPHCLTEAGYGAEDLLEGAQLASPEQQTMAKVLSGDVIVIDY